MIIHQDRYMDFFYMDDLINIIEYSLNNPPSTYKDINMSYLKKYKLSDITSIINDLSSYKVDVIIENENFGLNYTGNGELLNSLNLKLKVLNLVLKNVIISHYEY